MGGGAWHARLDHCQVVGNTASADGGGTCGGTLSWSAVTGNRAQNGAAAVEASLDGCQVFGNTGTNSVLQNATLKDCSVTENAVLEAGAIHDGGAALRCEYWRNVDGGGVVAAAVELDNCVVAKNTGNGVRGGTATSCTVVDNSGWGVDGAQLRNSIVWGNGSNGNCSSWSSSWIQGQYGVSDPLFVDSANGDYQLLGVSPCVDAGSADYATGSATDVRGAPRVQGTAPDMGAYEGCVAGVKVVVEGAGTVEPMRATLAAGTESVTFAVTSNGAGEREFLGWQVDGELVGTETTYVWANMGVSGVLTALFGSGTVYVDAATGDDANPGTSAAPVATIQKGVDLALAGDRVAVAPGTYASFSTADKAIVIDGTDGASVTFVAGGNGTRCATLGSASGQTNTLVRGLTLMNGLLGTSGNGGGACYGTLEDCVVSGNTASYGGGTYFSVLRDCVLSGNAATNRGGGAYYGELENCVVTGNSAQDGGGTSYARVRSGSVSTNTSRGWGAAAFEGYLEGVEVRGNTAGGDGGAMNCGFMRDCTVEGNESGGSGGATMNVSMTNCVIRGNVARNDGGGTCNGTIEGGEIVGNRANYGAGCYGGTLTGVSIRDNVSLNQGGATYSSTLSNCLVANNSGGGVQYGTATHCTIVGNSGWGVYYPTVRNSIIWGSLTNLYNTSDLLFSCADTGNGGVQGVTAHPLFVDSAAGDWRLLDISPCVDAGSMVYATSLAVDLAGGARIQGEGPDMGAFEGGIRAVCVVMEGRGTVTPATALLEDAGDELTFTVGGEREFLGWKVDGELVGTNATYVWSNTGASGVLTAMFGSGTVYVDAATGNDANDGTSTAPVATIQRGVELALADDRVAVAPGSYEAFSTANKAIVVEGTAGASNTVVLGRAGVRCATLGGSYGDTNTLVRGLTLTGADLGTSADGGGAIYGTLEDCVIHGNTANYGGGAYYSVLRNCVLEGNVARNWGGGAYCGSLDECEVRGNTANYAGGLNSANATNCVLEGNVALYQYGASDNGVLTGCEIRNNRAQGYVVGYGTLSNCVISGNAANSYVTYYSTLYDCVVENNAVTNSLMYGNSATRCRIVGNRMQNGGWAVSSMTLDNCVVANNEGNGVSGGTLTHCTVVGNSEQGVNYPTMRNSIVWGNATNYFNTGNVTYSCLQGGQGGEGCITNNPLILAVQGGDWRLLDASPCVDAGDPAYADGAGTDLLGAARLQGLAPDMGACEGGVRAVRVEIVGLGTVTPPAAALEGAGTEIVFTAEGLEGRPFLGWEIDGEVVGTEATYVWPNNGEAGLLTARFGSLCVYVDATAGNDANDGSAEHPVATIQRGVDLAGSTDEVRVAPGTYAPFSTANKLIVVVGTAGASETVVVGSS